MALFIGLYIGVIFMVVIYNIHWYVVTKEKSSLYYSIYKTIIVLNVIIAAKILPLGEVYLITCITMLLVFIILFTIEFLGLKKDSPLTYKILWGVIALLIAGYIRSLYWHDYSIYFHQPYSLVISPLLLVGAAAHRRGNKTAKYFVLSWGVGVFLVGISDLNEFGILLFYPDIPFKLVAGILESILLSYAIFVKTHTVFKENEEQGKVLIHQSKLAASGQMLENISHQWNQPLNGISAFMINMQAHILEKNHNVEYLNQALSKVQLQLEYMADTLHDFTNFHRRDAEKETFLASTVVDSVSTIIDQTLAHKNICFDLQVNEDFSLHSYPNELSQVLLNLVQNALDEHVKRKTKNATIKIIIDKNTISVQDNAGGIDEKTAKKIFDAYFTTKDHSSSLGLGLYMCNTILNKYFQTQLELEQTQDDTTFNISFEELSQNYQHL
jgi:signal transduction histidine kinase